MTHASSTATNALFQNPFFALSTKIAEVYSDAIRQNMENLTVSSAKIIQEQTLQAWTNAALSCGKALVENAMSNQQQAVERITDANRKAFGFLTWDLSPFKMPMTETANWFPPSAAPTRAPTTTTRKSPTKSKRAK